MDTTSEIDRIRGKVLSLSFFQEEERNDFLITESRKAVWSVLLDLLCVFQRCCEVHNLRYFAICGTALGAIRHNGFIPWDDDLDVAMPREDYEKLKNLKNDFEPPYSLVWPEVEPENGYSFLKLRNSNTTGLSKAFINLNINQGLFIDIFPLDEVKDVEKYEEEQSSIKKLLIENSNRMKALNNARTEGSSFEISKILSTYKSIESLATKDNGAESQYLALRTISFYHSSKMIWNKNVFKDSIDVPFESLTIKVPIGWKDLLETNYGEWQKFPPAEQRGIWHSNAIFDANVPYEFYKKSMTRVEKWCMRF